MVSRPALRKKCPYSEFFWSVFSPLSDKHGEIQRISSYSVGMRENTDQKNSEYGYYSRSTVDGDNPGSNLVG